MPKAYSVGVGGVDRFLAPTWNPPVDVTIPNPVQNTWYTILDTTTNVFIKIVGLLVKTTGEDLEARLTLDGIVYIASYPGAAAADTLYLVANNLQYGFDTDSNPSGPSQFGNNIWARSVKYEIRKTTNNGNGDLEGFILYASCDPLILPPKWEAIAALVQAAPVQNTWYTVLDYTGDGLIWYGAQMLIRTLAEDLQMRITIDGPVYTASQAPAGVGSYYSAFADWQAGTFQMTNGNAAPNKRYDVVWCKALKIEVRKTTANGAGDLEGYVAYGTCDP